VTAFEFNEDLKDCCLLLGAETAVTLLFKDGVPIMPETFYETHVIFPKEFDPENISLTVNNIRMHLQQLETNRIECSDIVLETKKGVMRAIYSIFCKEKKFTTKQLKYTID